MFSFFVFICFICLSESKCQLSCQDVYGYHIGGLSLIDTCNDMESYMMCRRTRDVIELFLRDYNKKHNTDLRIDDMDCESHISCSVNLISVASGEGNGGPWRYVKCTTRGRVDCTNQQALDICNSGITKFNALLSDNNITLSDSLSNNIRLLSRSISDINCRDSPTIVQPSPPISSSGIVSEISLALFFLVILFGIIC